MPSRRILLLVGDYVEDYEAMFAFHALQMLGHRVDAVCPGKLAGETVATAVHDFEGEQTYAERRGHNFRLTADFETVHAENYDGLVIPGGRAPEYLRLNPHVIALVQHLALENKPICAICHGVQVLAAADVLRGRRCTAYPALQPDVERCDAEWRHPAPGLDNAERDENLVTAPAWPADPAALRAFLQALGEWTGSGPTPAHVPEDR
jgi:protease I